MKRIDPLGFLILAITLITAFTMFFTSGASAEGNIAVNVSRVVEDSNWGVIGDYERGIFEVEGNLQSGDQYTGNIDASVTLLDYIRVSSKNRLKGDTLTSFGRENDLGAAFMFPIAGVDVAVGVFGRNGNPFQPRNAFGVLTDVGFAEADLEGLGLENLTLSEGISIKDGSTMLASLEAELDVGRFEVELQGLLEILGTDDKVQQLHANISTDGALGDSGFFWNASANLRLQKHGGVVEYEADYFAGIGKQFKGL